MKRNAGWALPVAIVAGAFTLAGATAPDPDQALPQGVTQAMIDQGKTLYHGQALCSSCHGENGAGTAIGPNLADQTWLHSDGSFPAIVKTINEGVPTPKESMIPMLAKGGSGITDEQSSQVAAYVWRLSHP
jgi:mono/diheme cytochrome c family protein